MLFPKAHTIQLKTCLKFWHILVLLTLYINKHIHYLLHSLGFQNQDAIYVAACVVVFLHLPIKSKLRCGLIIYKKFKKIITKSHTSFFPLKHNYWHSVFLKMCEREFEQRSFLILYICHICSPSASLVLTCGRVLFSLSSSRPGSAAEAAGPSVSYESAVLALINSDWWVCLAWPLSFWMMNHWNVLAVIRKATEKQRRPKSPDKFSNSQTGPCATAVCVSYLNLSRITKKHRRCWFYFFYKQKD